MMKKTIRFSLNGKKATISVDPAQTLLWVLRNDFGLTGTKYGCGEGVCGACTVLIDNEPARSCRLSVGEIAGKKIVTIEGLEKKGKLHPVQQAFLEHDALQCGFCTPGMILSAVGLLLKNPSPTRQEIQDGLEENLCRCGAHVRILAAVEAAAKAWKGGR